MKALLRTLLIVDGAIALLFGVLFLVTPWLAMVPPMASFEAQPGLIGQLLGVLLCGMGAMQLCAAFNGQLTATVAKVTGHTMWVSGVVTLVWLIAMHVPALEAGYNVIALGVAVIIIVLGLAQVRLGSGVRRRDRLAATGAASAARAERAAYDERPVVDTPLSERPLSERPVTVEREPVVTRREVETPIVTGAATEPSIGAAYDERHVRQTPVEGVTRPLAADAAASGERYVDEQAYPHVTASAPRPGVAPVVSPGEPVVRDELGGTRRVVVHEEPRLVDPVDPREVRRSNDPPL